MKKLVLIIGFFTIMQSVRSQTLAPLTELDLVKVTVWGCTPDAPGGGVKIDVEKKVICDFGLPSHCEDPKYSGRFEILQVRLGQMRFDEDELVPFVEYKGKNQVGQIQAFRIYGALAKDGNSQFYRAEGIPKWSRSSFNYPSEPFTSSSDELRCMNR